MAANSTEIAPNPLTLPPDQELMLLFSLETTSVHGRPHTTCPEALRTGRGGEFEVTYFIDFLDQVCI